MLLENVIANLKIMRLKFLFSGRYIKKHGANFLIDKLKKWQFGLIFLAKSRKFNKFVNIIKILIAFYFSVG